MLIKDSSTIRTNVTARDGTKIRGKSKTITLYGISYQQVIAKLREMATTLNDANPADEPRAKQPASSAA